MIRSERSRVLSGATVSDRRAMGTFEVLSGEEAHRRLISQAVSAYSFAGAVTLFVVVVVVELTDARLPGFRAAPLAGLGVSALVASVVFWLTGDRVPTWAFQPAFLAATVTISLVAYFSGTSGAPTVALLYLGLSVAVVIMLPRRSAAAPLALVALAYALVLLSQ